MFAIQCYNIGALSTVKLLEISVPISTKQNISIFSKENSSNLSEVNISNSIEPNGSTST